MPISAVDTISLAFQHTKRQLFQPFRFGQWTRLAIVGLLAGELGSGGSFHLPSNFSSAQHGGQGPLSLPKIDPALLFGLIATIVVTGLIFMVVMAYISSVMRFILFDGVLRKECRIRQGWNSRQGPGLNYFFWNLAVSFGTFGAIIVLLGIPLAWWALKILISLNAESMRRIQGAGLDGSVLAFTAFIALFTSLIFGLVPALRAASPNLNEFMKEGRSTTAGASHNRLRGMLVVAEMNTRGIRFDGKHNAVNNGIVEAVAGWREFLERDKVTMSLYNPRSLLRDVLPLYSKR